MTTPRKVFLVRAGGNGEDEDYVLENNLAVIGFQLVKSVENAKEYPDIFKAVQASMPNEKPRAVGNYAGQLWAFALAMKEGDIVVLPRKRTSQIALGVVSGPYKYQEVRGELRHTRPVNWMRPELPRTTFEQDLLFSFGAFMTVCTIGRNDAERRVAAVLEGKSDPGFAGVAIPKPPVSAESAPPVEEASTDIAQFAQDQIQRHIQSRFSGHAMSQLVEAVLKAEGWVTRLSPPGPDGGVDILAGRGLLGLDQPRLCVQVKSEPKPVDVTVYRTLQGSMQTFKADQGLLVAWGGFNKVVLAEAKQNYFSVQLWDSRDLIEAVYRNYERLPEEVQANLRLKRVWMLIPEDQDA
jgi:restriction system protein